MTIRDLYDQAADLPRATIEAELPRLLATAQQVRNAYALLEFATPYPGAVSARLRIRWRILERHDTAVRARLGLGQID